MATVPEPAPVFDTLRVYCGAGENVAVTATAAVLIVNVHVPVPEQPAPLQPANTDPGTEAAAVSVTDVPVVIGVLVQAAGQLMPPVLLVTVPVPVPAGVTVTVNEAGMKFALTDLAALIVTAQAPVPEHAPLQPAKTEAAEDGVAASVTTVFWM